MAMTLPDGSPLIVHDGVLAEARPGGRLVLWVRGEDRAGYRAWERIATAAGAPAEGAGGIRSVAASSWRAQQRQRGGLMGAIRSLTGSGAAGDWTLPGGGEVESLGTLARGLRLAWLPGQPGVADRPRLAALWPRSAGIRPLGPSLFLVEEAEESRPPAGAAPTPPRREDAVGLAEQALAGAAGSGDRRKALAAASDLGLTLVYAGDAARASEVLGSALGEAEGMGDAALIDDLAGNLAYADLIRGRPADAARRLEPLALRARAAGDGYGEKMALDRLARARFDLGDRAGGLTLLGRPIALAARLGDLKHEADLLWLAAIHLADLGHMAEAAAAGGSAVDRLRRLGDPAAAWYAHHLANFGPTVATPVQPTNPRTAASGTLRLAISAAKSMAAFVGSGFKVAPQEVYHARLAACAGCEHHTGLRCRVCGCITAAKARLGHERCPAGRW
ncbi:tetratricopeptide repeat protein (plasmid) [Isosphaeraceae bacterium EP7]